jgi:hypothetical protein
MMKIIIFLLILMVSMSMVSAVGIKYVVEGVKLDENSDKCVTYYVYNSKAEDIQVQPRVTQDLNKIIISQSAENKLVKAGTNVDNAEPIDFCFKVPKIYEADCLIGNLLCEQTCGVEEKTYEGEIILKETSVTSGSGSGSGASALAAAPLKLVVGCVPYERNWSPAYIVSIIIVLIAIGILLYKEYSTPQVIKDEEKLKKLQEKVAEEKGKK